MRTTEERGAHQILKGAWGEFYRAEVRVWTGGDTAGLCRPDGNPAEGESLGARGVLDFIAEYPQPAIFQLKDFHEFFGDSPETRRRLRDLYELCLDRTKFVVITSASRAIPEELGPQIAFMEL